nr:putative ribonuclease H-like domain-containing protein [Tanacetum cinerariifolium]
MKSGLVSVNTARQVNAAHPKTTVNGAIPMSYLSKTAHSTVKMPIHKKTAFKNRNLNQSVNTVKRNNVNTAKPKAVVNVVKGNTVNAEAVNTACYVQNKVLVVKPQNKTPYELFHGRTPTLSFMRPFGCHVTILNTKDHLGKFDGKADKGFFVGYSFNSKAFRVFNSITMIVEENLHIRFSESTPNIVGSEPDWLFDIDVLTRIMNYEPIVADQKSSHDDGFKPLNNDGKKVDEDPRKEIKCNDQEKEDNVNNTNNVNTVSLTVNVAGTNEDNELPFDPNMLALEDVGTFNFLNEDEDDDIVANMNNIDTTIQVSLVPTTRIHKDHPLDQVIEDLYSATQTRQISNNLKKHGIEAIRLFLAYASFKDFVVYQMDVKSAFLYGKIKEKVYVCQPPGFEDSEFPDRVYKVEKALYGLHQAPRAWKELCNSFERLMHEKFQMSSMRELTFFLRLQVKQKNDGIFISQYKYVAEIPKKFRFTKVKNASTHMETQKLLLNDEDGEEVDVHMYRHLKGQPKLGILYPKDSPIDLVSYTNSDYGGASLDKKSTTKGWQLLGCRLISWQCKKQTVVANSTTKTKYVTASSCCGQAVYKELDDRLVRATTTTSSLEAEQDSGNIDKTQSKATPNEASSLGTTLGGGLSGNTLQSDKDRIKLNELMDLCTNLQTRVIDLEKTKTTQALEITSLKKMVKKLEKKQKSRTHKLKILYKVSLTARVDSSEDDQRLGEDSSKHGKKIHDIDADEDSTLVNDQDEAEMFDVNDLHGKEVFVEKEVADKEVSAAGEVNVASIARTVSAATTIITDEITLAQALKLIDRAFNRVNTFVDFRTKLIEGSSKRAGEELTQESTKQKVDDDKETSELKELMEIIPDKEEVAIMLYIWLLSLQRLLTGRSIKKERRVIIKLLELMEILRCTWPLEDLDLLLWGDLKTMFEPHVEDQAWKKQHEYKVLEWKLYDSCGVHSLRMQSMHIYMLVKKKYPLTAPTLTDMLNKKLQADHFTEMAYQLLKLITKKLKNP